MTAWQHRAPIGRATIGDQLRRHARTQPDKVAFVTYAPDRAEVTYAELDALANRWAHLLAARGVDRGHVVAMLATDGIPAVAAYYGALKLGATFTVVNPMFRAHEVAWQLEHAEPTVVIADPALVGPVDGTSLLLGPDLDAELAAQPTTEPDAEVDESDVAMLVYTSGTTATPKGVLIPHRNYLISTAPAWSQGLQTGPDDTWLFVMPLHTIAGLGSMTTLTLLGATLVLPATVDPAATLPVIAREGITVIAQTPTFYLTLAAQPGFGPDTVGRCAAA